MYHLNKQTMPKSYPLWNKVENSNTALSSNKKSQHSGTPQLIMEHIYSINIQASKFISFGNAGLFSIPLGS